MTREEAHQLVDRLYDAEAQTAEPVEAEVVEHTPPEGKKLVRTKTSGDRVYLLDEMEKTRQWVTKPEIIDALGFLMEDVEEVTDSELLSYAMASPLYRVEDEQA